MIHTTILCFLILLVSFCCLAELSTNETETTATQRNSTNNPTSSSPHNKNTATHETNQTRQPLVTESQPSLLLVTTTTIADDYEEKQNLSTTDALHTTTTNNNDYYYEKEYDPDIDIEELIRLTEQKVQNINNSCLVGTKVVNKDKNKKKNVNVTTKICETTWCVQTMNGTHEIYDCVQTQKNQELCQRYKSIDDNETNDGRIQLWGFMACYHPSPFVYVCCCENQAFAKHAKRTGAWYVCNNVTSAKSYFLKNNPSVYEKEPPDAKAPRHVQTNHGNAAFIHVSLPVIASALLWLLLLLMLRS